MPNSKSLEDNLSVLAYQRLKDTLPELNKYVVGFQLIETDDEGNNATGMLMFNINGEHYTIPVIYANGYLKPLIILYNPEQETLQAATNDIVEDIIKQKPGIDATLVSKGKNKNLYSVPNLYDQFISPILSKSADRDMPISKVLLKQMLNLGSKIELPNAPELIQKYASINGLKVLKSNPEYLKKLAEMYPQEMANLTADDEPVCVHKIMEKKDPLDLIEIRIIKEPSSELSEEDNQKILRDNYIIKDHREITSLSHLAKHDLEDNCVYGPPKENGFYKVLDYKGDWIECFCLVGRISNFRQKSKTTDAECNYDKNNFELMGSSLETYYIILPNEIGESPEAHFCDSKIGYSKKIYLDYQKVWKHTVPITEVKQGQTYILMAPDISAYDQGRFLRHITVSNVYINSRNLPVIFSDFDDLKITVKPRGEGHIDVLSKGQIVVSPDIRALPLKSCDCHEYKPFLGSFQDLKNYFWSSGIKQLNVEKKAYAYNINGKEGDYIESLEKLLVDYDLCEKKANLVLSNPGKYIVQNDKYVKQAYAETRYDTPYIEVNNDPFNISSGETYYQRTEDHHPVPSLDRSGISNYVTPQQHVDNDIELAMRAANSGVKEVNNAGLLEVLSKNQNTIEQIKQVLPVIKKFSNMLGMLLFGIWWKPDKYKENFNMDELYKLENVVLDLFKKSTDLNLELSKRMKLE